MAAPITRRSFGSMLCGATLACCVPLAKGTKHMDVAISVECKVVDGILRVAYAVKNSGNWPLVAYDGASGLPADAEWPSLDGQLYISVQGDSVALKRVNPPEPEGVDINRVFIPPLSQTLPGQERKVRFSLKLPLTDRSQYTPDFEGAKYKEHAVRRVELYLGCFWKTAAMELQAFPDNPKAFRLKSAHGQQTIVSATTVQTVPVRERVDNAFRRT